MTYLTIKEVGKRTGLTGHTIRHYTDIGLIPDLKRDVNNNRLFDEMAINWLFAIKFLRQSGMSLREVRSLFDQEKIDPTKDEDRVHLIKLSIQRADENLAKTIAQHHAIKAQLQSYVDDIENCQAE